jgi:O-antigen/teichoic acid export membrane protein
MFNKKNTKNILANLFGRFWSIGANLAVVPIYLSYFSLESFGMIALYTSIILAVNIADAGLSPSFARDVARADNISSMANPLKTLEYVYLSIFCFIVIISICFGGYITELLIDTKEYSAEDYRFMVVLMTISAGIQLCTAVYRAGFMGLEKQVKVNVYIVSYSIARLFVPLIIFIWTTDLIIYFEYQLLISIIYFFAIRRSFWSEIGESKSAVFDKRYLSSIKNFAGGLFVVSIMSAFTMQLDKFMVSHFVGMESLSLYTIATSVSLLLYSLCLPLLTTFYPKITKLTAQEKVLELSSLLLKLNNVIAYISICTLLVLFYFAYDIVYLWTSNTVVSRETALLIPILSTGTFFLCLQLLPYHVGLANGYNKVNMILGALFIFYVPLSLYILISRHGLVGSAYNWVFINVVYYLAISLVVGIKFEGVKLALRRFLNALIISFVMVGAFELVDVLRLNIYWLSKIVVSVTIGTLTLIVIYYIGKKNASFNSHTN